MYFIDDNLTVSNHIPDSSSAGNTGLKRRHGICTAKPTSDMIGPLHVYVFNKSKYMLNGVTMKDGFEDFINENCATWQYNYVELQSPESNAYAYHGIAFCLSRINSMSHYDYISMFSDNLTLNDILVAKWLELTAYLY